MDRQKIRNFSIIAHIDHGKSTLADRILEHTGTLTKREMSEQVLDQMDLEKERGITIKLQAVALDYKTTEGEVYKLNLIDTPGHVDFAYEVSRSLAACEGAILVVDAAQGIEAQTLANVYLAMENELEIIPVINKIDLPNADVAKVKKEVVDVLGVEEESIILASAKEGLGIDDILQAIVEKVPAPECNEQKPLRALIFDSHFDNYRGVIVYTKIVEGEIKKGEKIKMMSSGKSFEVIETGKFRPAPVAVDKLTAGEVGFIVAGIKEVKDTRVGDTITKLGREAQKPLPGYKKANPMVYCGLYPVDNSDYTELRDALDKLILNDAALVYEPENSVALGFGYRCGFLGLLHMEIIQERLEREYGLELIVTAPNVIYHVYDHEENITKVDNPAQLPEGSEIQRIEEPYVKASVIVPQEYIGAVMEICQEKRGTFKTMDYLDDIRVMIYYDMPLSEILYDFFDNLKSKTRGYASLDYEFIGYKSSELVKLDIKLNEEIVDALSVIVHKDNAYSRGRALASKLREIIPRQMFEVPIQAAIGNKIIARETVKAMRKNVLAKCYGGDITRKRKLIEKQKEGKKRMKQLGKVEVPQEAFMAVLKLE
ncbi:translation elongation factor 4 [Proteinivorax tanatarense]|uniref:Elongation factor 4 n=1 Tax=Proteinivorax tanatarense TaxID=1260629 RepID=A0AAU7VIC9_9FIRM